MKPYYFTFTTYAKGRWVGRTVYDVFCREFQSETPEFYVCWLTFVIVAAVYHSMWLSQQEKALKAGKITGRWTNRVISRLVY